MSAYALLKIKPGAKCFQDFAFYTWPLSDYGEEGKAMADISDDAVFIGKKTAGRDGAKWDCKTHGAGVYGNYGNGGIIVRGEDSVELLTPLLAYQPELPLDEGQNHDL